MTNYSKSRIYKIWCDIEGIDEFYIGSTVDFKERCRLHLDFIIVIILENVI